MTLGDRQSRSKTCTSVSQCSPYNYTSIVAIVMMRLLKNFEYMYVIIMVVERLLVMHEYIIVLCAVLFE